ncbi:MAG: cyclic lactone autoinducer peptide [Clostridia bacterium]|nr:cyclic lactone autoinducer peptide [Clostridia bacterium]
MKKWMLYAQSALCAVAMFVAVNSMGPLCLGRYYQPEVPHNLKKFAK